MSQNTSGQGKNPLEIFVYTVTPKYTFYCFTKITGV